MEKVILNRKRVRSIYGSFGFIPHTFLRKGFIEELEPDELVLYLFFVLAADSDGISFYSDPSICRNLRISKGSLEFARQGLIQMDLIAFAPPLVQLLSLPDEPVRSEKTCENPRSFFELMQHLKE